MHACTVMDSGVCLLPCYLPRYQPDTHLLKLAGASPTRRSNRCCYRRVKICAKSDFEILKNWGEKTIFCQEGQIWLGADFLGMA